MKFFDIKIRVNTEVRDFIKKKAEKNGRSMNKQIIQILKDACKDVRN